MESVRNGFDRLLEVTFEWLPQLIGAVIIIIVGNMIAKALSKVVRRLLTGIQLDNKLHSSQGGSVIQRVVPNPTNLLEKVTYWLVFIGALSLGATVLGIDAINNLIYAVYGYVPQVVAALVIFLVGSSIAAAVAALVNNTMGDTPTGKMLASMLPVIVIAITVFAILDQLGIAPTIVTITYAVLLGSVGLGSALAFGLGGRDVAARLLETTYEKGQQSAAQMKADVARGKERAKQQTQAMKNRR